MKQRHEKGSERQIKNKLKERKRGRDQRDIRYKREKERYKRVKDKKEIRERKREIRK